MLDYDIFSVCERNFEKNEKIEQEKIKVQIEKERKEERNNWIMLMVMSFFLGTLFMLGYQLVQITQR
jgi:predicted nucleic acid-binding Zn ribbon protein